MASDLPKTMSGIQISQTGGPEVLHWKTDLPVPELKEGEVLVRNDFAGVNFIDVYFRTGLYPSPLPLIPGKEGAGTIVTAHPSVTSTTHPDLQPGRTRVAYLGDASYASYTAVPAASVVPIPDGLSTEIAAASLLQGLTALTFVREAAGFSSSFPNQDEAPWVLVHAAAGGTGSMLVQILSRVVGARVIGTAGGPEKGEIARWNGAKWVVDSQREDVVRRVMEITGGYGVDVIFDGVGKATFDGDLQMVARKGTVVVFGNASGPVPPVDLLALGAKNVKLMRPRLYGYLATPEENARYTKELFDMLATGKVTISMHDTYPLQDAGRAHSDLEGRKTTGKLLLKI